MVSNPKKILERKIVFLNHVLYYSLLSPRQEVSAIMFW